MVAFLNLSSHIISRIIRNELNTTCTLHDYWLILHFHLLQRKYVLRTQKQ